MKVSIRRAIENDFPQIIDLFQEFALFEKIPEKMINSANKMVSEKEYFNCFIAETDNKEIIG
jgi:hypothetical protein